MLDLTDQISVHCRFQGKSIGTRTPPVHHAENRLIKICITIFTLQNDKLKKLTNNKCLNINGTGFHLRHMQLLGVLIGSL